jgi:hypothetical protein
LDEIVGLDQNYQPKRNLLQENVAVINITHFNENTKSQDFQISAKSKEDMFAKWFEEAYQEYANLKIL